MTEFRYNFDLEFQHSTLGVNVNDAGTSSLISIVFARFIKGDKGDKGDKGEKGDTPVLTADEDGVIYADGEELTDVVKTSSEMAKEAAEEAHDAAIEAGLKVFCTQEQYDAWEAAGLINPDYEYNIYGIEGEAPEGKPGRGILTIAKTSTSGDVDTYTITYSDYTTSTFNVTNGHTPVFTAQKVNKTTTIYVDGTALATILDGDDAQVTKQNVEAVLTGEITSHTHPHDTTKQDVIDADHKLPYSYISNTPDIPTKTSDLENDGDGTNPFLTQHQSLDAYRTAAEQDQIHDSTKQDTISDLADIRTGAAAGATAVQPSAIADMETQTHAGQTYAPITTTYTKTEVDDLLDDKADASDVEAIEAKIPAQATEQNQLADKEFVNSSISTETAHFLGTSQSGLTEAQFLAWANGLENKTNNDYVFWNTTDAASNVQFKKYKYNADTTSWLYEYTLNNSSFTASQWAAISSGITANLVSSYDSHVADSDIHVTTNNKSAWNAKYDKPQNGIPSSDMTQAVQTSLGLADSAYQKPNGGIPSTDMSSAVQTSLGKADTALQQHQDISGKVDKITGKGLSTNDYDNTEKSHVADAFAIVALFNALGLSVVNGKINITYNI